MYSNNLCNVNYYCATTLHTYCRQDMLHVPSTMHNNIVSITIGLLRGTNMITQVPQRAVFSKNFNKDGQQCDIVQQSIILEPVSIAFSKYY